MWVKQVWQLLISIWTQAFYMYNMSSSSEIKCYWRKYVHEVLVSRLEGLKPAQEKWLG